MITATSFPSGVKFELSRAPVLPGTEPIVDEWMAMLNDRLDECVATLDRERMALELAFRHVDGDGSEWLYWVSVQGANGGGNDPDNALDADHVAFAKWVKGPPGWEELTPHLFLAPDHIRSSIVAWAAQGVIE